MPQPIAMPTEADAQMQAAVVRPRTELLVLKITPAPRNPIPLTICAAMRVGSARVRRVGRYGKIGKAVSGEDHQQRRSAGNDAERADTRFLEASGTLQSDDGAAQTRKDDANRKREPKMCRKEVLHRLHGLQNTFHGFLSFL